MYYNKIISTFYFEVQSMDNILNFILKSKKTGIGSKKFRMQAVRNAREKNYHLLKIYHASENKVGIEDMFISPISVKRILLFPL